MTTYQLSIGYNACENNYADHFAALVSSAELLRDREDDIVAEVGMVECFTGDEIRTYAGHEILSHPENRWLTIQRTPEDGEKPYITLWASTGEPVKYAVRRAMVRLIMRDMHAQGIELNVSVG